jgi:hypothetical protein
MQQVYKVVLFLTNGKLFKAVGECDNPTNETFCMISRLFAIRKTISTNLKFDVSETKNCRASIVLNALLL